MAATTSCFKNAEQTRSCGGQPLHGAGPASQAPAMAVFRAQWAKKCPDSILSYQVLSSSAAVEQFLAGSLDFAVSDSASAQELPAVERCGGAPPLHLPLTFSGISLIYNLDGGTGLTLNGTTLGRIFNGQIANWNNPRVAGINRGSRLPDVAVVPVITQEPASLSGALRGYLDGLAPSIPEALTFAAPLTRQATSAAAAIDIVKATPGAIAAVDSAAVGVAGMPAVRIDSGKGPVAFSLETAQHTIDGAEFASSGDDLALSLPTLHKTREPDAYPLVQVAYAIVCQTGQTGDTAASLRSFLDTAVVDSQSALVEAGFIPPPEFMRNRISDVIDTIG